MTSLRERRGEGRTRPREYFLEAGREYTRRYGADALTAAAFAPAAAKRAGRPDLVERYYAGREDGTTWPSLNALKRNFGGSFNKYRAALGLPPNTTGPARGRRQAGEAEPILNVRERRVVVEGEGTAWLRKQLAAAERRAARAEERLELAKRQLVETSETGKLDELRRLLHDEKSRRRKVQRELMSAERREARAKEREEALRLAARDSPVLAKEVDRLTARLAKAKSAAPRTVTKTQTRTVIVQDEALVRRAERAEKRVDELRDMLAISEAERVDLRERLGTIRQVAITEAIATRKVQEAERKAVDLEKRLANQAELLVGERRQLTEQEMEHLRSTGPAGYVTFAGAIKRVARARAEGSRAALKTALTDTIAAALNWRDRL